jgi:predicted membrane protein
MVFLDLYNLLPFSNFYSLFDIFRFSTLTISIMISFNLIVNVFFIFIRTKNSNEFFKNIVSLFFALSIITVLYTVLAVIFAGIISSFSLLLILNIYPELVLKMEGNSSNVDNGSSSSKYNSLDKKSNKDPIGEARDILYKNTHDDQDIINADKKLKNRFGPKYKTQNAFKGKNIFIKGDDENDLNIREKYAIMHAIEE